LIAQQWKLNDPKSKDADRIVRQFYDFFEKVLIEMIKSTSPKTDVDAVRENFKVVSEVILNFEVSLQEIAKYVEDFSLRQIANGFPMKDLIYTKVNELDWLINPARGFMKLYVKLILTDNPESFDLDQDLIMTSQEEALYLKVLIKKILETPTLHLEAILWWSVMEDLMMFSSQSLQKIYLDYLQTVLGGSVLKPSTMLRRCVFTVDKLMGLAVTRMVIEDEFDPGTVTKVEKMFENIKSTFDILVNNADWMDHGTKRRTISKSARMDSLIGLKYFGFLMTN
jgi:Peptidase family M13